MRIKAFSIFIADLVAVFIGYIFALWLRLDFSFSSLILFSDFFRLLPLVVCIYLISLQTFKVHRSVLSAASVSDALAIVVANIFATSMIVLGKLYLSVFSGMPRSVIVIGFFVVTLLLFMIHFYSRSLRAVKSRLLLQNTENMTLIYGAGNAGRLLVKEMLYNEQYGYHIRGFIDDDESLRGMGIYGFPILGTGSELKTIVSMNHINHIIVAMPSVSQSIRKKIANLALESGVKEVSMMSTVALNDPNNIQSKLRKIEINDLLNRNEIEIDCDEIGDQVEGKCVLVTGAGGSIGSELVRQIVTYNPSKLVLFDINETGLYNIEQELLMNRRKGFMNHDVEILAVIGSIRDKERLERLFEQEQFNIVFHAAAHKHVPLMETSPAEAIKNNIFGTKNLIDVSIDNKVEKFINISTDKAVNPTNVMGATKRFIEMMIQSEQCMNSNTKFVAVRFGNVLGSNGSVIPLFQRQIDEGGPVTVTDPNIVRYFMTIPEAVSLVLQAATFALGGEIFVLDMGEPVYIKDLAINMIRLSGYEPNQDILIEYTGLRPGEKLYEELLMGIEGLRETKNDLIFIATPVVWKDSDIQGYLMEIEKSLDYQDPIDIKRTLEHVITTYKSAELH